MNGAPDSDKLVDLIGEAVKSLGIGGKAAEAVQKLVGERIKKTESLAVSGN